MPTYTYVCQQCGHSEEVFHEMSADVKVVCDACMIEKVRKPSTSAVSFKGGGWASKE